MPTPTLTELFADVSDAIRAKDGTAAPIAAAQYPARIRAIPQEGGGGAGLPPVFGARRLLTDTGSELERIWDAEGLTASVGVDDQPAANDFDAIAPWCNIRECAINMQDGVPVVAAYKGDAGYTRDGSVGDIAVEIPRFWVPGTWFDDAEIYGVSASPIPGWAVHPAFVRPDGTEAERIYVSKYCAGFANPNSAYMRSYSGVQPVVYQARSSCRNLVALVGAHLLSIYELDAIKTLFAVEFATLDSQSVMPGVVTLDDSLTKYAAATTSGTNTIRLTKANAALMTVGGLARISNVSNARRVVSITSYSDTHDTVTFDGAADPTITTSVYINNCGAVMGAADGVAASSGYDTQGVVPGQFVWRGIEGLWGNLEQHVDGIVTSGGNVYVTNDPSKFGDAATNHTTVPGATWATSQQCPTRWSTNDPTGLLRLPITTGAATTYDVCARDKVYGTTSTGARAVAFGGACYSTLIGGEYAGLHAFDTANAAGSARMVWRA